MGFLCVFLEGRRSKVILIRIVGVVLDALALYGRLSTVLAFGLKSGRKNQRAGRVQRGKRRTRKDKA